MQIETGQINQNIDLLWCWGEITSRSEDMY